MEGRAAAIVTSPDRSRWNDTEVITVLGSVKSAPRAVQERASKASGG